MSRHRSRAVFMCLVLCSLAGTLTVSSVAQEKKQIQAQDKSQLDRDSYRFKVEEILEPLGEVAVYRVQVWTVDERPVDWAYAKEIGGPGIMRPEKDGKLFRTDFVLTALLRKPPKGAQKAEVEIRWVVGGTAGMTEITDDVDPTAQLKMLLEFTPAEGTQTFDKRLPVARFRGKLLSIGVER